MICESIAVVSNIPTQWMFLLCMVWSWTEVPGADQVGVTGVRLSVPTASFTSAVSNHLCSCEKSPRKGSAYCCAYTFNKRLCCSTACVPVPVECTVEFLEFSVSQIFVTQNILLQISSMKRPWVVNCIY